MTRIRWKLLIGALLIVSLSLIAYALLTSATHQITESVISSGGDTISSPSYNLLASVGQTGTDTLAGASYTLSTGLFYFRQTPGVVGTVGDSLVVIGEAHQVVANGGSATLLMDVKDSGSGGLVANAIVNLTVEYEGSQVATDSASADTAGRISKSVTLSSGDGAYVITATRSAARAVFVAMTDKRRVPAHPTETPKSKWVMIAPFRNPDAGLTGLGQLSYGGTPVSYAYDPSKDAGAPWYGYVSVTNQPDSNNVSARGTFSRYERLEGVLVPVIACHQPWPGRIAGGRHRDVQHQADRGREHDRKSLHAFHRLARRCGGRHKPVRHAGSHPPAESHAGADVGDA